MVWFTMLECAFLTSYLIPPGWLVPLFEAPPNLPNDATRQTEKNKKNKLFKRRCFSKMLGLNAWSNPRGFFTVYSSIIQSFGISYCRMSTAGYLIIAEYRIQLDEHTSVFCTFLPPVRSSVVAYFTCRKPFHNQGLTARLRAWSSKKEIFFLFFFWPLCTIVNFFAHTTLRHSWGVRRPKKGFNLILVSNHQCMWGPLTKKTDNSPSPHNYHRQPLNLHGKDMGGEELLVRELRETELAFSPMGLERVDERKECGRGGAQSDNI